MSYQPPGGPPYGAYPRGPPQSQQQQQQPVYYSPPTSAPGVPRGPGAPQAPMSYGGSPSTAGDGGYGAAPRGPPQSMYQSPPGPSPNVLSPPHPSVQSTNLPVPSHGSPARPLYSTGPVVSPPQPPLQSGVAYPTGVPAPRPPSQSQAPPYPLGAPQGQPPLMSTPYSAGPPRPLVQQQVPAVSAPYSSGATGPPQTGPYPSGPRAPLPGPPNVGGSVPQSYAPPVSAPGGYGGPSRAPAPFYNVGAPRGPGAPPPTGPPQQQQDYPGQAQAQAGPPRGPYTIMAPPPSSHGPPPTYMPPPPTDYGTTAGLNGGMPGYDYQGQQPGPYSPLPGQRARGPVPPANRVDPSQIPRPVEGGECITYRTVANGEKAPPSVCRKFMALDDGNCSPRFMRSTTYQIPLTKDLAASAKLPIAVICSPMALPEEGEEEVPLVDYPETGPVRCTRCKAYINVFATFADHGARWNCNLCGMVNDVPPWYQCGIDAYGYRRDREVRAEFCRGSVDFTVTSDYSVRPLQQPIYVFAVDVSPLAVSSGMMRAALDTIAAGLDYLPGGDKVRVGIVTFAAKVQFYKLPKNESESEPSVILLGDVDEPFSALPPDRWIIQDRQRFRELLKRVPDLVASNNNSTAGGRDEVASVAAVEAVADALETWGGRIYLFTSSRPTKGAGALRMRADPRDYGTEKEQTLYMPVSSSASKTKDEKALAEYYNRLGDHCASRQISVEIFVSSETGEFVDVATLGRITFLSSGKLHYYPGPVASPLYYPKFHQDVIHSFSKRVANETVLKVRTSVGLTLQSYLSSGVERAQGELEMAVIDSDQSFIAELTHDVERMKEGQKAYIQLALLYTSPTGRRMVRVHNLALNTTNAVASVFRYADLEAVYTYVVKSAVLQAWKEPLAVVRESVTNQCVDTLYQYRLTCASNSPPGQLILPESLKLMPLFTLALLKSKALRLNTPEAGRAHGFPDPSADERATTLHYLMDAREVDIINFLYPKLYEVTGLPPATGPTELVKLQSPSSEYLTGNGVFLLDSWTVIYLYVTRDVSPEVLQALFGIDSLPSTTHTAGFHLTLVDGGDAAAGLQAKINELRGRRSNKYAPLHVVVAGSGSPGESFFTKSLVDDRTKIDQSYVEYLCTIHKQIQSRMAK